MIPQTFPAQEKYCRDKTRSPEAKQGLKGQLGYTAAMMGRYFWFSICGFLFGIAVADLWAFGVALPLLFFALTIAIWASSRSRIAMLCAVMLFAGSIGALRVHIADVRAAGPLDVLVGENGRASCRERV